MPELKLVTVATSPFAARIRIQAYEKAIDLPVIEPPGGFGSEQLIKLNPFGKIPILLIDGQPVAESGAIQEYLEDINQRRPLLSEDYINRARIRSFVRALDLYLFPLLFELRGIVPSVSGQAKALKEVENKINETIERLASFCDSKGYICSEEFTIADCAMAPACFYINRLYSSCNIQSPMENHKVLGAWWTRVKERSSVKKVLQELEESLSARQ